MAPPHPAHAKHALCHFPNAVRTCDANGETGEAQPGQSVEFRDEGGRVPKPKDEDGDGDDAAAASSSSCRRRARSASWLVPEAPAAFPRGSQSSLASSSACMAAASAASSDAVSYTHLTLPTKA